MPASGTAIALLVIAVDIGIARLGYGLLLPAIRHDLHGGYAVYGAIGAVHLVGYLAGTMLTPSLLRDRARAPRITAIAHLVVAAAFGWSAAANGPLALGIARAVLGVAAGVGIASAITDAIERVPAQRRGQASALAWSGIGLGLCVSAPANLWTSAAANGWRLAMLAGAFPALVVALLAFGLRPQAAQAKNAATIAFAWRDLLAPNNIFFVAAYGGYGTAYIAYATFAATALGTRGFGPLAIVGMWFAFGAAAMLGALAVGSMLTGALHRWSMALPLAAGAAGSAISALPSVGGAVAGALCVGIGLAAAPAVASAFARDRSDAGSYARAFAAVTTVFGVCQIAGPLLAGAAVDAWGLMAVPVFAAAVFGAATVFAVIDARRQATAHVSLATATRSA